MTHYLLQLHTDVHQAKDYEADADEPEHLLAEWDAFRHAHLIEKDLRRTRKKAMRWHLSRPNGSLWGDYLLRLRNAARRAAEPEADSTEASVSEDSTRDVASSDSEGSSSESLHLVTPMVRFLVSDFDDTSSQSSDSSVQEVPIEDPIEADETSSEDGESLESWSDPDRTLATISGNPGLAINLF